MKIHWEGGTYEFLAFNSNWPELPKEGYGKLRMLTQFKEEILTYDLLAFKNALAIQEIFLLE